jgi:hypothetical protein
MRYRTFAVAVLGGAWSRIVLGATMFLFPLYFQLGLGASPIEAGYLMAALAIGQIALRLVLDPLRRRLPPAAPDRQLHRAGRDAVAVPADA